jgi:hypothetical protein
MNRRMISQCLLVIVVLCAAASMAEEPRLKKLTILVPDAEADVVAGLMLAEDADGTRSITTVAPRASASRPAEGAFTWSVDLKRGTYSTRRVPLSEEDLRFRERLRGKGSGPWRARSTGVVTTNECSEYDTGDGWIPCDQEIESQLYTYGLAVELFDLTASGPRARTELEIEWKSCPGELVLQNFDHHCYLMAPGTWNVAGCNYTPPAPRGGTLIGGVVGTYQNFHLGNPSLQTLVMDLVRVEASYGGMVTPHLRRNIVDEAITVGGRAYSGPVYSYPTSNCATGTFTGGGGGGGGGESEADETYCVPVYSGETGAKLGDCCGTHNHQIIECAKQYLY